MESGLWGRRLGAGSCSLLPTWPYHPPCVVISEGNVLQSAVAFCKLLVKYQKVQLSFCLPTNPPRSPKAFKAVSYSRTRCSSLLPSPCLSRNGPCVPPCCPSPRRVSQPQIPPAASPKYGQGSSSAGRSLPGAPADFALGAGNVPAGSWLLSQSSSSPFCWFSGCWLVFYVPVLLLPLLPRSCFIPLGAGGVG